MTAGGLVDLRHEEIGGDASISETLVDAELSKASAQVYKSGNKYCLKTKGEDSSQAAV